MSTSSLISHNVGYLRQALVLLDSISDAQFTECRPPFFESGIGDHLRHIIEHYQCFLAGLPEGRVNYDARKRDGEIARDRAHAGLVVQGLLDGFQEMPGADDDLEVCLDGSDNGGDEDPWSRSTARRELQYLQAHTVHHYALIAFILRLQGCPPPPDFGVAPSTLRHRKAASSRG
ncbi:MAG: DinB family protein [Rhodothermales bacterium]|nr:DinB family protein [Rhodothermales bacterium]